MESRKQSIEGRLATIEEALRHLAARLSALEERVAERGQVVVDEIDDLRTDVEHLKEAEEAGGERLDAR